MSLIELSSLWKSPSISAGRVLERASERANVWTIASLPSWSCLWHAPVSSLLPGYHVRTAPAGGWRPRPGAPYLQAVQGAGVLAADLAGERVGQVPNQPLLWVGGVHAREVTGVHQHVVRAELIHHLEELTRVALRRVER